uniref:Protein kinase domain-containing protein n=1 Tax=Nothobranchius furzeri TaxID=105023 RepID=A0A8C6LA69_NOTFU
SSPPASDSQCLVIRNGSSAYTVEKVLGSGSFGEVAKCTKVGTNEIVAVKVMPKHQRAAAEDEEKALKHLCTLDPDKNNLIKFYESFTFKGNFFFVFEILDMSLFDLLDKLDWCPPSVAEIRAIAQQMLVALSALKSIGVSHTDIKSDNIMLVDHSSQPFKAKLIDFGLACKTEELSQYKTFQPVGYRAPEVHFGVQKYEGVDMFGLGCTLAHLFLGGHLFPIYSDYENVRSSSVFDILTSLDDLLMLSWDPADRIQPADALKHTFINMKHLPKDGTSSYVTAAHKIMAGYQNQDSCWFNSHQRSFCVRERVLPMYAWVYSRCPGSPRRPKTHV